jgi:hypothetical protein
LKRALNNANQRNRRAKRRRIDYCVSAEAFAIINAQSKPQAESVMGALSAYRSGAAYRTLVSAFAGATSSAST